MVEREPFKLEVVGSSPTGRTSRTARRPTQPLSPVDEYVARRPGGVQATLRCVQAGRLIRKGRPGAEDVISFQFPAYLLTTAAWIYFAGWKQHDSLYPGRPPVTSRHSGTAFSLPGEQWLDAVFAGRPVKEGPREAIARHGVVLRRRGRAAQRKAQPARPKKGRWQPGRGSWAIRWLGRAAEGLGTGQPGGGALLKGGGGEVDGWSCSVRLRGRFGRIPDSGGAGRRCRDGSPEEAPMHVVRFVGALALSLAFIPGAGPRAS